MKKRILAFILTVIMVMTIGLTGCGKDNKTDVKDTSTENNENTDKQTNNQSEDQTANDAVEVTETNEVIYPVDSKGEKLTIWLPIQPPAAKYITSYNDQEVFQEISRRTGIEVEFIHPAVGQEKEQLGLLMASGELPDIIQIRGLYSGGAPAGVDDGVFLDLTELMPKYAPDYYKAITENDLAYRLSTTNDGRLLQFNILKQTAPAFERINFIGPIMEKYNIQEMPVTIADYEALFEKFAQDGLPAFSPIKTGQVEQFMWPYGIAPGWHLGKDGNIRFGAATEEYKDYLTMMNKWYKAGYIYKDFMSNMTPTEHRALFTNLQVGMHIDATDLAKSMADSLGYNVMPANYPRLSEGQQIPFETVRWETLPDGGSMATVITTSCKNPELAMQYLNYFYTQEGSDLANWGIEGKSYEVDEQGNKKFTDYMFKNEKIALGDAQTMLKIHLFAKLAEPDVVCNPNIVVDEKGLALRMMYSDDKTVDNSQVLPGFQMSSEASVARNDIMVDINTYIDEMTLKFITGDRPLTEFDDYLNQLKEMGVEEAIAITTEEYQKFMNKPVLAK